jgi:hypothetical protein
MRAICSPDNKVAKELFELMRPNKVKILELFGTCQLSTTTNLNKFFLLFYIDC